MSATRCRLIGPATFEARQARGLEKSCLGSFIQKQASGSFLFIVLLNFMKCVITVQPTNNIKGTRCVEGHGGKKKLMFPSGKESKERSAIGHHVPH